ncbi:hypothetical protein NONO_c38800 [Nocardia nova SH22a]|uniref:Uncharacterized protein n=1 Tax=Nocardia nova SH22a TaxID=1415166 RepID=W5THM4_9NOCA|nr:hypothetical protein [Nocardia nova]AHH18664.1 hypothetical protein NONO_c38800 [Nocardia nova SH22a]
MPTPITPGSDQPIPDGPELDRLVGEAMRTPEVEWHWTIRTETGLAIVLAMAIITLWGTVADKSHRRTATARAVSTPGPHSAPPRSLR